MHKKERSALKIWAETAPSTALGIPNDAVRCLCRILWRMKAKGLDSGRVGSARLCVDAKWIAHVYLQPKEIRTMQCRRCSTLSSLLQFFQLLNEEMIPQIKYHRSNLPLSHLAHSVVPYLGLTAPSDLEEFGIMSAGDLVDTISRVSVELACSFSSRLAALRTA